MRKSDIGIKIAGVVVTGGLGMLVGELLDNTPYVSQALPEFINQITRINFEGHLDKLIGITGATYGLIKSKYFHGSATLDGETITQTNIYLPPITVNIDRLKKRLYG